MINIKNTRDIPLLLDTIKNSGVENLGMDLRNIANGTGSKEEKITRIAIQFEEMLINSLLKETFKEEENKEEGLPLSSGSYGDLRRIFLSQYLAESGGLGYREVIEQQLKDLYFNDGNEDNKAAASGPLPVSTIKTVPSLPTLKKDTSLSSKISSPVTAPVSSNYGWRKDPFDGKTRFHAGIDFEVPPHTPVKSFMAGDVTFSGWQKGYGYLVEIKHANGLITRYGHNAKLLVKEGDHVESGAIISLSGSSGRSTGPHLHFEVRKGEFSLDPANILDPMNRGILAKMK